jgi:DNA anti-recombination protein RmuC
MKAAGGAALRGAVNDGIEQVREILLGDVIAELERRLARLDHLITHRTQEVHHVVRTRTDVLEEHLRKELQAQSSRAANEKTRFDEAIRTTRDEHRGVLARIEQRISQLEERLDGTIARIEREVRDQVLAQSKTFIDELERVRVQLRAGIARELGMDPEAFDEQDQHAGAWAASH